MLLIGARKKDVEEELGIDLNEEKETADTADLFQELKIRKESSPSKIPPKRRVSWRRGAPANRCGSQTAVKRRGAW